MKAIKPAQCLSIHQKIKSWKLKKSQIAFKKEITVKMKVQIIFFILASQIFTVGATNRVRRGFAMRILKSFHGHSKLTECPAGTAKMPCSPTKFACVQQCQKVFGRGPPRKCTREEALEHLIIQAAKISKNPRMCM